MTDHSLFSTEHIELVGMILIPMLGGIWYIGRKISQLIWQIAQMTLKVDLMWDWHTNHGSSITGYKPGDELKGIK